MVSYKNRSKEYDWFKGKKNNPKEQKKYVIKTTWKFTKIFLMFSLFFFSLWGCAQVFTIKTNSKVGSGVEFYSSEEDISPFVSKYNISVDKDKIYSLERDKENIWLNKFDDKEELSSIQEQLNSDKENNLIVKNVHKMSDAYHGINLYTKIIDENKRNLSFDNSKYLAISSEQNNYLGIQKTDSQNKFINNFKIEQTLKTKDNKTKNIEMNFFVKKTDSKSLARVLFEQTELRIIDEAFNKQITKKGDINEKTLNENLNAISFFVDKIEKPKEKTNDKKIIYNFTLNGEKIGKTTYVPITTWSQAWVRGVGPFYGLFVWPIAKMSMSITNSMGLFGGWESLISIVIVVFLLRIIAFLLTFKSVLEQTKQQELQAKKAIIDSKYSAYKGNKQMEARKRQEVSQLYKKEGISPLGALGTIFITMPIFLSIWRVIGGIPHLKSTVWLGINFSETSYKMLFQGEWQYLPLMFFAAIFAAISQIFPRLLTKKRDNNRINVHQKEIMKKNNKMQNVMLLVTVFFSLAFSAGIQIYWIVGGIWQIIQTLITHYVLIKQKERKKRKKIKI